MEPSAMIPLVAIGVGIPGFIAFVAMIIRHTRKMKELEIRERELALGEDNAALAPAVDALHDSLSDMRAQLADMQERLEFAERLLVAGNPAQPGR